MPRDGSGNYTLPLGNPVIDGTVIDVNWANPTMNDIAVQLNNVVTRDGLLGFTSPAFFVDGTSALPGIAFAAQHGTGIWRNISSLGLSYAGVSAFRVNSTDVIFDKPPNWATLATVGSHLTNKDYVDGAISTAGTGYLPITGGALSPPGNLTVTNFLATNTANVSGLFTAAGGAILGDAAGDALTINSFTVNIPNGINLNGGNVGIGRSPLQTLDIQSTGAGIVRVRGGAAVGSGAAFYVAQGGSDATLMALGDATAIVGGPANTVAALFVGNFPFVIYVGSAEKIRVDTSGNIRVQNTLSPPATFGGAGSIYVEAGALKYLGSSGTITVIAPA